MNKTLASLARISSRRALSRSLDSRAWLAVVALGIALTSCAKPKQAEVPDVDKGSGVDMAGEEPQAKPATTSEAAAEPAVSEMKAKCCASCKEGLAKDRTGAAANTIPCADFTAQLSPWCLEHFRAHPMMASECK
jgi:hypothetical protein